MSLSEDNIHTEKSLSFDKIFHSALFYRRQIGRDLRSQFFYFQTRLRLRKIFQWRLRFRKKFISLTPTPTPKNIFFQLQLQLRKTPENSKKLLLKMDDLWCILLLTFEYIKLDKQMREWKSKKNQRSNFEFCIYGTLKNKKWLIGVWEKTNFKRW